MSPALHILKKDLRRYNWAWISLLALALLHVLVFGTDFGLNDSRLSRTLTVIIPILNHVIGFVLLALVVQEENLADPDAYWLTRPMPRLSVLTAKIIFCLVILISIPLLGNLVTLLLNQGYTRLPLALASGLLALGWTFFQIFLAAQTRSFPRYILLIVLLYVVITILGFVLIYLISDYDMMWNISLGILPAGLASHWVSLINQLYWTFALLGLLIFYYARRRLVISWLLLLPVLAASAFLNPSDSDLTKAFYYRDDLHDDSDINVSLASEVLGRGASINHMAFSGTSYTAQLEITGVPEGSNVWIDKHHTEYRIEGRSLTLSSQDGLQQAQRLGREYPDRPIYQVSLFSISRDAVPDPDLSGTLNFTFTVTTTYDIERMRVPLASGTSFADDGNRFTITTMIEQNRELHVTIRSHQPEYSLEPTPPGSGYGPFSNRYTFALLDPASGTRIPGRTASNYDIGMNSGGTLSFSLPPNFKSQDAILIVNRSEITSEAFEAINASNISLSP